MSVSRVHALNKLAIYKRKQHKTNTILKLQSEFPRLIVTRSLKHMRGQIVSTDGKSLVQITDAKLSGTKSEKAFELGKKIADAAQAKNISKLVFDRNGFFYHGRVAKLAEGAREGGLEI
ncbi:MAG: hypothetical protein RL023_190 [Candidatus Parcubacteria bacterium]|jgi:large subunit ribosomal protein L18